MIYIIGQVRCKVQGVSYIISKRLKLWSTNGFKLEVSFYPPSVNSAFHFIARLRTQRSANGTQPNFDKWWALMRWNAQTICRRKVGVVHHEKNWGKKPLHLFGFSTISGLNGEYLLTETRHRQSSNGCKVRKVSYIRCPKISWTLVHKRLKTGLEVLPTLTILFCPSPSHPLCPALTSHTGTSLQR